MSQDDDDLMLSQEMPESLRSALSAIPKGYRLAYTEDGQPKLVKVRKQHLQAVAGQLSEDAANEVADSLERDLPDSTTEDLSQNRVIFYDTRILELMTAISENPDLRHALDPYDFQLVVTEMLERLNYKAIPQKRTRDKGVDVIAEWSSPLGKFVTAVQCKKYAEHRKVEPCYVQQLIGVVASTEFDRGLLITTSAFGPDGILLAKDGRNAVSLQDGGEFIALLRGVMGSD